MTRSAALCGEPPRLGRRFIDSFEVDLDLHFLADQDPVRDRHVPREAEVAAVDGDRRSRTEVPPTLSVLDDTDQLDVEAHGPGYVADGEITARGVMAIALREDRVALERDLRVFLRVEEVGRLQVAIALRVACRDPFDRRRHLEVALLGLRGVELDTATDLAEASANGAQHHGLHRKVHCRVRRIDVPEHMFFLSPDRSGLVADTIN